MMRTRVAQWKIRRSGAGMTITGLDASTGADLKVAGVESVDIQPVHGASGPTEIIAVTSSGDEYQLEG